MSTLFEQIIDLKNLEFAFEKVKIARGTAGVDNVSIADFAKNSGDNLVILRNEIVNRSFKPMPLKKFTLQKDEGGKRILYIPSVRDRILSQAIVIVLQPLFEKIFHNCSYAYRPGRSAQKAIERVERNLKRGRVWCLDLDIKDFFDSIDREILGRQLKQYIDDNQILNLIKVLIESGDSELGLPQGLPVSPLLSNVYLHPLDDRLIRAQWNYIRYSDNVLVLDKSKDDVEKAFEWSKEELKSLNMSWHPQKTAILHRDTGFTFLGYRFDKNGKRPAEKALQRLGKKMSGLMGRAFELSDAELRSSLNSLIKGWRNYFKTETNEELIRYLEKDNNPQRAKLVQALIAFQSGDIETAKDLVQTFESSKNVPEDAELVFQWGVLCDCLGLSAEAFDSYQAVLRLGTENADAVFRIGLYYLNRHNLDQAVRFLQKAVQLNPKKALYHFTLGTALQSFALYGAARKSLGKAAQLNPGLKMDFGEKITPRTETFSFQKEDTRSLSDFFKGREDCHARQWINDNGKTGYQTVRSPLTEELWKKHLNGEITLGFYPIQPDNCSNHLIFDLDVTRQVQDEFISSDTDLDSWQQLCRSQADKLLIQLRSLGLQGYVEKSGFKGMHIWLFFKQAVSIQPLVLLAKKLVEKLEPPPGLHWEYFPDRTKISENALGCLVKLPFGLHKATQKRCYFLNEKGEPIKVLADALGRIHLHEESDLQNALEKCKTTHTLDPSAVSTQDQQSIEALFSGCNVLRFLQEKAEREKRLTHIDRLTLVSVLGHLGDAGRLKLHEIIKQTLNYDFRITDKWFQRTRGFPVSCPKIRLWQANIIAAVGCFCKFKEKPESYPSPVLYVDENYIVKIKNREKGKIKSPAAKPQKPVNSKSSQRRQEIKPKKKKSIKTEAKPQIETIVGEYLKVLQQKRKIDDKIKRLETQLDVTADQKGVDILQTAIGTLRRIRLNDDGTKWVLEL
ncbi:hypothetical protein GF406_02885 [candidate division KSB1 bacterium]|nr:hypothetical protein [candidate division KSB1 bacterium]